MDATSKIDLMRAIKDEVVSGAHLPLYAERIKNGVHPVIGEGSHDAAVMFIGEAPGKNEAATGRPFCGAAGKLLDHLLASIDIPRADVYITNIVKDRPQNNRDPLPEEIASYAPYLDRQIDIIRPKVIATLGRFSMRYIMEKFGIGAQVTSITAMHGRVFTAGASHGPVTIFPLYHPAAALYNPELKKDLEKDFQALKSLIGKRT